MADLLVKVLRSSKEVFWMENEGKPEPEIQRLWESRMAYLTEELGATPTNIGQTSNSQKRAIPSSSLVDGPRPFKQKRRDLVGFPLLAL
jgi:hypothetical protein